MTIKHIVLCGGGPAGLITYGAAKELAKQSFWSISEIKTIYGTSVGSLVGVILSLDYDWEWLDDYFIKRPWEQLVNIEPLTFIETYTEKGLLGEEFIEKAILPLLQAKNLTKDTTLKTLFEFNNIEIHMFATEINAEKLEKIDISHISHPDLTIIKALTMSTAYPFVLRPVCEDGKCYIDGGLLNNYPLTDCIERTKCNTSEILSFKNKSAIPCTLVTDKSTLLEYFTVLVKKIHLEIDQEPNIYEVKNTVHCLIEDIDGLSSWVKAIESKDMRKLLINKGSNQAKLFLEYKKSICAGNKAE